MLMLDFDAICRLCLEKGENLVSIFGENGKFQPTLSERIENCACLKVCRSDGLPDTMCMKCVSKLDQIKEFRDQCKRSDDVLRQYLEAKQVDDNEEEEASRDSSGRDQSPGRDMRSLDSQWKVSSSDGERGIKCEGDVSDNQTYISLLEEESKNLEEHEVHVTKPDIPHSKSSKKKQRTTPKRKRSRKNINVITDATNENGSDDNEYIWPGSLSDEDTEPNSLDIPQKQGGESPDRQKKRTVRSYECEYCGRSFPRSNHLAQHELTHTKEKPFHCSYCEKSFWYKNSLIGHIKQNHTGDVNYTCEECGKGFFQRSEYNRHKPIHSNETPFKCNECGMSFKLVKNLRRHQKVHTGLRNHTCQYCGKSFRMLQTLRVHLILHTGEKPYKCTYCGKGFSQSAPLKAHTRTHTGERPYVCNFCGEAFPTGNSLKAHIFKHTGIHPNSCKDCSLVFKRKRDLLDHRDRIHDGAVTAPVQVPPQLPQEESTPNVIQQQPLPLHNHQSTPLSQSSLSPPNLQNLQEAQQHIINQPNHLLIHDDLPDPLVLSPVSSHLMSPQLSIVVSHSDPEELMASDTLSFP